MVKKISENGRNPIVFSKKIEREMYNWLRIRGLDEDDANNKIEYLIYKLAKNKILLSNNERRISSLEKRLSYLESKI